jgi:hypothetical protein
MGGDIATHCATIDNTCHHNPSLPPAVATLFRKPVEEICGELGVRQR